MSILCLFSFSFGHEIIVDPYGFVVFIAISFFVMLIVLIDISDPRKIFKTCGIVVIVNHLISSESASKLLKVNLGAASISIEYDIFYDWKIDGFIEFTNGDNDFAWMLRITKSIDGTICIIV